MPVGAGEAGLLGAARGGWGRGFPASVRGWIDDDGRWGGGGGRRVGALGLEQRGAGREGAQKGEERQPAFAEFAREGGGGAGDGRG